MLFRRFLVVVGILMAIGALAIVVNKAVGHELVVTVDEATIPKTVKVEPLKFRVVVEPSNHCRALRDRFIKAAGAYTSLGRKHRAVTAMNIAQRAVSEGCWR